jgi:Protein of unknown function (DUF2510)
MSIRRASLTEGRWPLNEGFPAGWYPDPADVSGLRYWDGEYWTEHRAALSNPIHAPAVCTCGVVATGSCRVCSKPFCRAHISDQRREDRAFQVHWEAWTCGNCIEQGQRYLREQQLERCESVAPQLAALGRVGRIRTTTGLKPRPVNVLQRSRTPGGRPVRRARAYLIMYDGGAEDSTYQGLAISGDATTVFDIGVPTGGVRKDRIGPKHTVPGYLLRTEITLESLREAAERPTTSTWFEYAARAYLKAAKRLGVTPMAVDLEPETDLDPAPDTGEFGVLH